MDRVGKEKEILHHLDGMENLLVRVFRHQEAILCALNQLHSDHARTMCCSTCMSGRDWNPAQLDCMDHYAD
jgi:hypothetical protein